MLSFLLGKIANVTRLRDDSLTRVELARLEGAVTALTQAVAAFQSNVTGRLDDHENRIRLTERWRLSIPPTLIASVTALLVTLFHH